MAVSRTGLIENATNVHLPLAVRVWQAALWRLDVPDDDGIARARFHRGELARILGKPHAGGEWLSAKSNVMSNAIRTAKAWVLIAPGSKSEALIPLSNHAQNHRSLGRDPWKEWHPENAQSHL